MKVRDIKVWLEDEIKSAEYDASESARVAPNSYGAGYDLGFRNALERVKLFIENKLDT